MQSTKSILTGIVLAGGSGRRMGGCNKGLLRVNGQPLVNYAAANLSPHADVVLVNSNSHQQDYRDLGFLVIDDGEFAHCGPLAGILAGLRATTSPYIAIAACDQLPLPGNIYPQLLAAAQANSNGLAVARDGERLHPTCAVVAAGAAVAAERHLRQKQLRVGRWFKEQGASEVCFPGVDFHNINTPDDVQRVEQGFDT